MNEIVEVTTSMFRDDAEYLQKAIQRGNGHIYIYTRWERWQALAAMFVAGFSFSVLVVIIIILKGN